MPKWSDTESIPLKNRKVNLMVDKSSLYLMPKILQAKRMQDLQNITFITDNEKREMFDLLEPLEAKQN